MSISCCWYGVLCMQVVLSCKVNKINKKGYSQNRILLITDRGIYNLVRDSAFFLVVLHDVVVLPRCAHS